MFEPTAVSCCASGYFTVSRNECKGEGNASTSPSSSPSFRHRNSPEVFVLKGKNLLELYQVTRFDRTGSGPSTSGRSNAAHVAGGGGSGGSFRLKLLRSVGLSGEVQAIATLHSRTSKQRDALVLLTESVQMSVLEFLPEDASGGDDGDDDAIDGFRTTSLHSFADYDAITLARNDARGGKHLLKCDPQGRMTAMMFRSDFVALVPTKEHNLDELLQIDAEVVVKGSSGKEKEKRKALAPANRLCQGTDVLSLLEVCKISHVRDMCFLHGYNEPVLCFLHESAGPTWPGRLREARDTCGIKAFSINTAYKRYPKLLERTGLPYDAFAVQGVPGVGGKCLVLCTDYMLLLDHRTTHAVALNKFAFAGFAKEVPVDKMPKPTGGDPVHSFNVTNARKNAFLVIPEVVPEIHKNAQDESRLNIELVNCKLTWLQCFESTSGSEVHALLTLKSGQLIHARIRTDATSLKSPASEAFAFRVCGSTSMPSCMSTLGEDLVFVGSMLGDSILIRSRLRASKGSSLPLNGGTDNLAEDDEQDIGNQDVEMDEPKDEDAAFEESLFGSEDKSNLDTLALTVSDRISNLGPILDMVNISTNTENKNDLAVAACVGYGKHSALAILSQNLMYDKMLQVDLPDIIFLQTVYSETSNVDAYHTYLILSTVDSTMILETKEELEVVTDKVNFVTDFPTICAGNLFANSKIVQVYKKGIRVLNGGQVAQDISCDAILAKLNPKEKDPNVAIKGACVCDPFVLVLLSEGTLCLMTGSREGKDVKNVLEISSKSRINVAAMDVIKNSGSFFDSGVAATHLAFICDNFGSFEVVGLPNFASLFKAGSVYQGFTKLVNDGGLGGDEIVDEKASSRVLVSQMDCQVETMTGDLWVSFMISDGFLYIYKLEGSKSEGHYLRRKNISNEFLIRAGTTSAVPRRIVRLENVNTHSGYFVTGDKPFVVFLKMGQARIYSAWKDGPITSFTNFHNVNCKHGFVCASQTGQVYVCNLNSTISTTFSWCAKLKAMDGTVHKITYSAETRVLAALVSKKIPYRPRKPEAGGGDAHATNVYAAQEASLATPGVEEAYEVQLISPETFEVLWSHTLDSGEVGLSISSVYIKNQTDQAVSSLIAVGSAIPRGEDYPCRGVGRLFKIEKQDIPNAEVGQPSVKWGANLITRKDFKGSPGGGGVHIVSCLDGFLLAGIGMKVLLFKWNGEHPPATPPGYPDIPQLEQCGFFDSTLFTSSFATVKKFVLSGDSMKGINFLRWHGSGNQNQVLQQLSHDYEKPPIHHVQFIIEGSTLTIMGVDMYGNVRIYAFDPSDPDSFKGKKLLGRAIFYLGSRVSRVLRITAKTSSDSPAATVSHKIGACLSSYDASLGMLLPLDETTFKRLRSLQNRLIASIIQPAGLNPMAYRRAHYIDTFSEQLPASERVLDGNIVWKFLDLTIDEQNKLARLIGSRRETVLNNLKELSICMSIY